MMSDYYVTDTTQTEGVPEHAIVAISWVDSERGGT